MYSLGLKCISALSLSIPDLSDVACTMLLIFLTLLEFPVIDGEDTHYCCISFAHKAIEVRSVFSSSFFAVPITKVLKYYQL